MIFVDSNIPMYIVGADHPNKRRLLNAIDRITDEQQRLVTDAEVIQEILHRFVAIKRRDAIQAAIDVLLALVDDVFPIDEQLALRAKDIVLAYPRLSARDAIHVSVMKSHAVDSILTFDDDFRHVPGINLTPI